MECFEENWYFFVTCSSCPQNCKRGNSMSLIWQERGWEMNKKEICMCIACNFFSSVSAISNSYTWVNRRRCSSGLVPPRFSMITCSSIPPFLLCCSNFTWRYYRDTEVVSRVVIQHECSWKVLGHQFSLTSFRRKVKSDHRSKFSNLSPWPPHHKCDALPTELWSHTMGARSTLLSSYPVQWNDVKYIWNYSYLYCGCRCCRWIISDILHFL